MINYKKLDTIKLKFNEIVVQFYTNITKLKHIKWWAKLWKESLETNHTSHPYFVVPAYDLLNPSDISLVAVTYHLGNPVAVFPMMIPADKNDLVQAVPHFSDYWDPVIKPGYIKVALETWCKALMALNFKSFLTGSVAKNSCWVSELQSLTSSLNFQLKYESQKNCPRLYLRSGEWPEYLQKRRRLRRHLSALDRNPSISINWWPNNNSIEKPLTFFFEHHLRRFEKSPYHRPEHRFFLENFTRKAFSIGLAGFYILTVDGTFAALALWLYKGRNRYFLNGAWDLNFKHLAPGKLLHSSMVRETFSNNIGGVLDYMTGNEPYKFHFANETIKTVKLRLSVNQNEL